MKNSKTCVGFGCIKVGERFLPELANPERAGGTPKACSSGQEKEDRRARARNTKKLERRQIKRKKWGKEGLGGKRRYRKGSTGMRKRNASKERTDEVSHLKE